MPDQTCFDAVCYLQRYRDLSDQFRDNYEAAYRHWITYGIFEGRDASCHEETALSRCFNAECYINRYPDVAAWAQGDPAKAYQHWLKFGRMEGRNPSCSETETTTPDSGTITPPATPPATQPPGGSDIPNYEGGDIPDFEGGETPGSNNKTVWIAGAVLIGAIIWNNTRKKRRKKKH